MQKVNDIFFPKEINHNYDISGRMNQKRIQH